MADLDPRSLVVPRVLAGLVDLLLAAILGGGGGFALALGVIAWINEGRDPSEDIDGFGILWVEPPAILLVTLLWLGVQLGLLARRGQTVGMRWLGVQAASDDGPGGFAVVASEFSFALLLFLSFVPVVRPVAWVFLALDVGWMAVTGTSARERLTATRFVRPSED
jgi:uncharacterized RDD family membrane protein YckC